MATRAHRDSTADRAGGPVLARRRPVSSSARGIPVEVRAVEPAPPPADAEPRPTPAPAPVASSPPAPEGFVAARGVDLGPEATVWGPVGGVRLGRRALPVVAVGCRVACAVRARVRLVAPKRRSPVALRARSVELAAGGAGWCGCGCAGRRGGQCGRARVRAVLSLGRAGGGSPVADTLRLRVTLPGAKRP